MNSQQESDMTAMLNELKAKSISDPAPLQPLPRRKVSYTGTG